MKYLSSILYMAFTVLLLFLNACTDNRNQVEDIDYVLVSQLVDIGNGQGENMAIDSDKTITIGEDLSISVNGDLCSITSTIGTRTTGILVPENNALMMDDCQDVVITYVLEAGQLTLQWPCREQCYQVYVAK